MCQSILFYSTQNNCKKSHNAEKIERGDPLGFFSVAKFQNIEGGPFGGKKL